jgi:mannosyltransferase OCH1-like enzyme
MSDAQVDTSSVDTSSPVTSSVQTVFTSSIPKIIMQTWKTTQVPDHWKTSPESVKTYMPDWKYVLMTDETNRQFVQDNFPDFLNTYDNFEYPIQRADAIRYMWLYINGGVYMDLDFELTKPLDPLFQSNNEVYLAFSANVGSVFTNAFMASKPRSNFWLEVLDEMTKPVEWYHVGKHLKVMNSTGPLMLTRVARKSDIVFGVIQSGQIAPCSVCEELPCKKESSYTKTLEGSSWIGYDTSLYLFCMCNWQPLVTFLVIFLILIMILYMFGR